MSTETTPRVDPLDILRTALGGLDDAHVHELVETVVGGFIHGMIDDFNARKDEIVQCVVESITGQLAAVAHRADLTAVPDPAPEQPPLPPHDACRGCGAQFDQAHVGDCPEQRADHATGRAVGGRASNSFQDASKRTCVICGREGSRRFTKTELGWRCSPSATKCPGNRTVPPPPAVSDIPVKPIQPLFTTPPKPDVTARCRDCPQTWKLTGRVLDMAVDLHEAKRGHMVEVLEAADV